MTRSDAAKEVKSRYAEYLKPARKRVSGRPSYICPICSNGTGSSGDGMTIDPHGDGTQLKCFKCGFYGDVVDLYQKEHNCSAGEAFSALYDLFNIKIDAEGQKRPVERREAPDVKSYQDTTKNAAQGNTEATFSQAPDFTDYFKTCRQNLSDPAAVEYLNLRGVSLDTADRYYIGYDRSGYVVIPCARSFYVARATDPAAKLRYRNPTGASIELFNKKALYNDAGRPVFIVEGAFDALAVIEAGAEAVALNSTSNTRKLIKEIENRRTDSPVIVCLDADDAGQRAAAELIEGLRALDVTTTTADICGGLKDPNEAFLINREAFTEAVQSAERATSKPYNTADYIRHQMAAEIAVLKAQASRKTGFDNLDAEAGSVYAGLYCIGAISSLGKTTFINQLCDQMAAAGEHILFFSMEQSRLEMVSKSLSRLTKKNDPQHPVSSIQIRTGAQGQSIDAAVSTYLATVGDRVSVIEGNYNCTVSYIGERARAYRKANGVTPCIVVDYLQILRPDADPDTGRKPGDPRQIVDNNLIALKRLSRELETPVFVVCSVNRSNYLTPIDFEAFKESGCIEFTSDVIWGLQLEVMNDPIFAKEGKLKEKREKVADAKSATVRRVELVCLKNRFGKTRYSVLFDYYPQYDYFTPSTERSTFTELDGDDEDLPDEWAGMRI
jgi:replicative DNA helicase